MEVIAPLIEARTRKERRKMDVEAGKGVILAQAAALVVTQAQTRAVIRVLTQAGPEAETEAERTKIERRKTKKGPQRRVFRLQLGKRSTKEGMIERRRRRLLKSLAKEVNQEERGTGV